MTQPPRIVETSLRQWGCAYARYEPEPYALGQMVAVHEGPCIVLGVVAEAQSGPEDPTRPIAPRGQPGESASEVMDGNPEIRLLLRTRMTVVTCGYLQHEGAFAVLPPTPPPLLAEVLAATPEETTLATRDGSFLSLLLSSPASDNEVMAAAIKRAAAAHEGEESAFAVTCGKELARLLKAEPSRLATILRSTGL